MTPQYPELINAAKSNTDNLLTLLTIAFSGVERLTALNLNVTRAALEESAATSATLAKSKSVKDPLQSLQMGPPIEKMTDYFRQVQKITTETQQEMTHLLTGCLSSFNKGSAANQDWGSASGIFNKMSQQMTGIAEANVKAFTAASEKLAPPAAAHAKKSA